LARSEAFFSVTGLVIPVLGGLLAGPLGWRVAFALGAIAAAIGLLAVVIFTRASTAAQSVGSDEPRPLSETPGWRELRVGGRVLLAAYLTTFVVFFCRNGLLNAVLPVLGAERLGFAPVQIGLLFSILNAIGIGVVLLGGRLGDRFGRYRLLVPGLALLLVAQLSLLAIQNQATYVLFALFQGVGFLANALPPVLLGDALPARLRPRGIAIYRAVSDIALLSAPAVLGLALEVGGFTLAELVNAGVALVTFVLVWLVTRRLPLAARVSP
jgi:DHA1 family bicyclomycin/chloramphenicol resistance-like MFS transporter